MAAMESATDNAEEIIRRCSCSTTKRGNRRSPRSSWRLCRARRHLQAPNRGILGLCAKAGRHREYIPAAFFFLHP